MGLYEKTRCDVLGQLELLSVQKYKNFWPRNIFIQEFFVMHDIGWNLEILVDLRGLSDDLSWSDDVSPEAANNV